MDDRFKRRRLLKHFVREFRINQGRLDDGEFVGSPHFIGNSILLYGRRSSCFPYHAMVGPDWSCMIITYALIIVPSVFFIMNVGGSVGPWVIAVGTITTFLTIISFSITACSDPGIIFDTPYPEPSYETVEKGDHMNYDMPPVPPESRITCGTCNIMRPRDATHCYSCGVCVEKLDHHCPWTGKCIGKKNIKYFYGFLYMLNIHVLFVIVLTVYASIHGYPIFELHQRVRS